MASSAKICTLLFLLAAQQVMILVGTAAASSSSSSRGGGGGGGGCIRRVDDVSKYGSCHCYRKCSHPEEGWLTNAASQRCFVDCVLRHGCVCPGDDGEAVLQGTVDDGSPPATTTPKLVSGVLPALLDETTVSITVPRPKVSRSRIDKEQQEEMLVVEATFVPGTEEDSSTCFFAIRVSTPSRPIRDVDARYRAMPMNSEEARSGRAVLRIPIGNKLEEMGADGDNNIVVSFDPPQKAFPAEFDGNLVETFKKYRLTIRDVRIEYERKN